MKQVVRVILIAVPVAIFAYIALIIVALKGIDEIVNGESMTGVGDG